MSPENKAETKVEQAAQSIQKKTKRRPRVGLVLGSGLGPFADGLQDPEAIAYSDIDHFLPTGVEGHKGQLVFGSIAGVEIVVCQGRLHAYEGHDLEDVVLPVRTLAKLGVQDLILTNASGGINENFHSGQLVLIRDHINLTGRSPLVGPNIKAWGPRFPDMTEAYHPGWQKIIRRAAQKQSLDLGVGVYAGVLGPTYETPAEIHMLRTLGADMVGMSTVPEVIAAHHMGLNVCGISCITNMAAGLEGKKLAHEDIKDQAQKVMERFIRLLEDALSLYSEESAS